MMTRQKHHHGIELANRFPLTTMHFLFGVKAGWQTGINIRPRPILSLSLKAGRQLEANGDAVTHTKRYTTNNTRLIYNMVTD